VDFSAYRSAFALLVRYPKVLLGPFVAGIVADLLLVFAPAVYAGRIGDALAALAYRFISLLIVSFGLSFALIGADQAWRGFNRSIGDCAFVFGRRLRFIFFTALGANFMVFVASQLGDLFGPLAGIVSALLSYAALYVLAYAYAGAAIDGIPAATAIEMSIESAWEHRAQTAPLALLSLAILQYAPPLIEVLLEPILTSGIFTSPLIPSLVIVTIVSVFNTYLAFVIAKTYADIAKPQPLEAP
jgi:hypothetical protein